MIVSTGGSFKTVRTVNEDIALLKSSWDSFSEEEQSLIVKMLEDKKEYSDFLMSLKKVHYNTIPVSWDEFLDDEYYSGPAGKDVFPKIREEMREVFAGNFSEVIMSGSIGWGKSFSAVYGMMYVIYRICCLADPHETLGISSGSKIIFGVLSLTVDHAKQNLMADLVDRMKRSMFFSDIGARYTEKKVIITKRMEILPDSTRGKKVIGTNLVAAIVDEVNFGDSARVSAAHLRRGEVKTVAELAYDAINRRIKSRYMSMGQTPGVLFLVSSSNSDSDFTKKRIKQTMNDPSVYVMSYAEWETKMGKFSGEKFKVFFGGNAFRSRILSDNEEVEDFSADDNARIIEVPIEYKSDFERNIEDALRDIAGVSVPTYSLFFQNQSAIAKVFELGNSFRPIFGTYGGSASSVGLPRSLRTQTWFCGDPSPFDWSSFTVKKKEVDKYGIERVVKRPRLNPNTPRVIHLDPAVTRDAFGFSMGHINRMVDVVLRDRTTGQFYKESNPEIVLDFGMRILAPPDGEISFQHIRRLIYELRENGFFIAMITMDTWNTVDMRQILSAEGFATEILSLDSSTDGYDFLKSTIYQGRFIAEPNAELQRELSKLEFDANKRKVDHPKVDNGKPGSKDVADAAAGVCYTLHRLLPMEMVNPEFMADSLAGVSYNQDADYDEHESLPSDIPPWLYK